MKSITLLITIALVFGASFVADAELHNRGRGLIYDDVLDVTWISDAKHAAVSGDIVDADGNQELAQWPTAVTWASGLEYSEEDSFRLPSMDVNGDGTIVDGSTATEEECRDNELAYMYYQNLSGTIGDDLSGDVTVGSITFYNLGTCWSSEAATSYPGLALAFAFSNGSQGEISQKSRCLAWVVMDGDVDPTTYDNDSLLMEDGNYLLLETGDKLLLE